MVVEGRDERGRFVKGHAPYRDVPGRPPNELSITVALRAYLEQPEDDGKTRAEIVAERLFELVKCEDLSVALGAIKHIQERIDGRVPEHVKVDQTTTMKGYVSVSPDDWPEPERSS